MRGLVLAGLLLAAPLAAQEHQPPLVSAEVWSLPDAPIPAPRLVERATRSGPGDAGFSGTSVRGDFTLETTLAYRFLADGDVAGIALRGSNGGWISLQLEQITPALLLAVRSHVPGGIDARGRLLATTAVSGWHQGRIRLKIERRGDVLQFFQATQDGGWDPLGLPVTDPTEGAGELGLFAVDGAER